MGRKAFLLCLACALFAGCAAQTETVRYDKNIRTFKFEKPGNKVSIGILYFTDGRSELEKLGVEALPEKRSIRQFMTKMAEEVLSKQGNFSSTRVITGFDLPDFYDPVEVERFRKANDVDYILGGEIIEAKLMKQETDTPITYKMGVFVNRGLVPDTYEYVGRVRVRGKLVSLRDGKTIWEGEGKSFVKESGRFIRRENTLIVAMHNALGEMLSNMSKVFALKVIELQ